MTLERESDQLVDDLRKTHSTSSPHFWEAGCIGQAGHRIDLVDQQFAGIVAKEEVDACETGAVDSLECGDCHLLDLPGKFRRNQSGNDELVVTGAGIFFGVVEK